MKLIVDNQEIDFGEQKGYETAIYNFAKECKYIIFMAEDGSTKVAVIE